MMDRLPAGPVDLLVGSDIGLWIVETVAPNDVGTVITKDHEIARAAVARGLATCDSIHAAATNSRAVSAHWPYVLTRDDLDRWSAAWNIHPSMLPWGRGYAPVFWSIWAGEPAGATMHVMTPGLDKGAIVDRIAVDVLPDDTGHSLYLRVLDARRVLFERWWPRLVAGEVPDATPQLAGGSYHDRAEFLRLRDEPDLDTMSARDLVRLCRALAMPSRPGPRVGGGRLAHVADQ